MRRRQFLGRTAMAGAGLGLLPAPLRGSPADPPRPLAQRFADLPRHFLFEYYPWYQSDPWRHWDAEMREPPHDIASPHMPALGPYDSRRAAVLEQHARWIADSGVGAINVSWWGRGSPEDAVVPLLMDVMRDHGLKVAFHLEPYADDHGWRWEEDVLHLLREYGERRRWDALLLLRDEAGRVGPVFKGFRTIVPRESSDCLGTVRPVGDHTPDDVYRRQTDGLRRALRAEFDHITLLADTTDTPRAAAAGFDGIALYDNYVGPEKYVPAARSATAHGLVSSFNVNPGFDVVTPRPVPDDPCYQPSPFVPEAGPIDWSVPAERERAAALSAARIDESFRQTIAAQCDPASANVREGFFLVYVNSFNEWHEGHAFEPMKDDAALGPAERAVGYHNPARGDDRLRLLAGLLAPVLNETGPALP